MTRLRLAFIALASVFLLSGCAGASPATTAAESSPPASTAAPTTSATATPTPSPTPTPTCANLTGEEALLKWVDEVPRYPAFPDVPWDTDYAGISGYDPCAELSWITLTLEGATVSTPCQIMLFHRGDYLGTATKEAYGFWPDVERLDDATIQVTYIWPKKGEGNADASGRTVATFTWDPDAGHVVMDGDVPPRY